MGIGDDPGEPATPPGLTVEEELPRFGDEGERLPSWTIVDTRQSSLFERFLFCADGGEERRAGGDSQGNTRELDSARQSKESYDELDRNACTLEPLFTSEGGGEELLHPDT